MSSMIHHTLKTSLELRRFYQLPIKDLKKFQIAWQSLKSVHRSTAPFDLDSSGLLPKIFILALIMTHSLFFNDKKFPQAKTILAI